jgi:hypothetical protein
MLLNSLKVIAFVIFTGGLVLTLSLLFRAIPALGGANVLGIDVAFVIGLLIGLPLGEAIFRRVSWLRFRGL